VADEAPRLDAAVGTALADEADPEETVADVSVSELHAREHEIPLLMPASHGPYRTRALGRRKSVLAVPVRERRGRHVFLNVAVYFDVAVTTIVCTAGLPSDQDTN
jgi:hypothetical protein